MPTALHRRLSLCFLFAFFSIVPLVEAVAQKVRDDGPVFTPGNLVVVVSGCGVQGGTCSPAYGDNAGTPLSLFQYKPTGTASATYVNTFVLPQVGSGANLPVSAEYGSSSEGTLQLSGGGQYLTVMGYGINAATYNANPATYGTLASKPTALAQSGSLTGQGYTPVARVVALVDANGNVNSATGVFNVFNQNNPRSVYTADGVSAYISGQGAGSDPTGGVFYTPLGAINNAPTPITGLDTTSFTYSQDTRTVQIYNGTLYVSVDTKEGSNNARSFLGTLGTPPATSLFSPAAGHPGGGNGPTQFASSTNANTTQLSSTSKVLLTASETNGINATGQQINLSPVGYFFANAYTLYIADSGNPKQNSASSLLGDGGLQKWVNTKTDGTGTWQLQYTFSAGLNLVANPSAVPANTTGTTGLYAVTGVVSGSSVYLYVTNSTIGDTDPTYLYGITDTLAATTKPAVSFTLLATAPANSNFKGVSFAPSYPSGSATLTTVPSGLSITTAGTGCAPGTYATPVTLIWTPGATCTLTTTTPQYSAATPYVFSQWQDGTTSLSDAVIASATPTTYTATFTNTYQPVGVLEKAVDNATTPASATIQMGDSLLVSGWAADPVDGAPLSNVKVYVDGNLFGTPTLGIPRPDVASAYSSAYLNSGYSLVVPTTGLALGLHSVTVIAVDSTGRQTTFGPLSIDLVATPVVTVSSGSIFYGTATTTLTATVAYTGTAAPMGGLSFTVNGSSTGVGAVSCTGSASPLTCTATYASGSLPLGGNTVVATEAGSTSYNTASGNGTLTVNAAPDFSFTLTSASFQAVAFGAVPTFTFSLSPLSYPSYPAAVSFSVSGLPTGATATFSPASVGIKGGAQTVTLSIQVPASLAANRMPLSSSPLARNGALLALLVLPIFLRRRVRSGIGRGLLLALVCCGSLFAISGLTGCSGTSSRVFPISTITVTATAGTVQHSASVGLLVQ
jgi:hypothetical protein